MSGIVEIEKEQAQAGSHGYCDDVFSMRQGTDHVEGLSNQFKLLQTTENNSGHLTDLYPTISNCPAERKRERNLPIYNINSLKSASPRVIRYACKTVSDSVRTGIRESSTCEMSVTFEVPRIVINSAPDVSENENGVALNIQATSSTPDESMYSTPEKSCTHLRDMSGKISFDGKFSGKHHTKNYYRPYCIISRRHYTCRSYTQRHRKYGVSQRNGQGDGVDELVQLLDQMATGETRKTGAMPEKAKWQYSPPPKYYMIRYKPHAKLTGIKERSKSLDDLHLGNLRIGQSPDFKKFPKPPDHENAGPIQGPLFEKDEIPDHSANMGSAFEMGNVVTGIRNLNM